MWAMLRSGALFYDGRRTARLPARRRSGARRIDTVAEPSRELITQAQQGDAQAISQLILSQQHYVYSIAMSVLKNPEDAADLTQEAFIRLLRALGQYNGESRFTTWLYRLVVNLCRDELRRRGRQVPVLPPVPEEEESDPMAGVADADRWTDPEQALAASEVREQVRQALAQLEEHYRLVLTLYYFEDLKYTDISEILDIPLNTVKSHIRRGKERLATLLETQEQPPAARAIPQLPRRDEPRHPPQIAPLRLLFSRAGG
jgi:RNA polymerase sigma-70 factor, ECF subfamily